ncbi:MAG: cation:proton antiporter [Planctomycetota bacterium]
MIAILLASGAHDGLVSETVVTFVVLLSVAVTIGVMTRFIRIPYTIALVLAGLTVALLEAAPPDLVLTEELVLVLFLPPLLFQAGLHLDLNTLQRKAVPVAILAIPGVLLSMLAVAAATHWFVPEAIVAAYGPWLPVLLFGAMLAPTDPISVVATFKTVDVPDGLKTLVEGESLFNDGTGVVVFLILLAAVFPAALPAVTTDHGADAPTAIVQADDGAEAGHAVGEPPKAAAAPAITIAGAVVTFLQVAGMGVVFGLGIGLLGFWLLSRLDDHMLENAITVVLVWGSFIVAERFGVSGVITVVVVGLIIGNHGRRLAMSDRTRETINTFWASIDFIINSVVFLLIGIELQQIGGVEKLLRPEVLGAVAAVIVALLASRAVMVYGTALLFGRHWPRGWKHVVWWAGLKGSISLALVLGLPPSALREFLVPVAFGVVLVSLLAQGLSMPALLQRVDLEVEEPAPPHPEPAPSDD